MFIPDTTVTLFYFKLTGTPNPAIALGTVQGIEPTPPEISGVVSILWAARLSTFVQAAITYGQHLSLSTSLYNLQVTLNANTQEC